MATTPSIAVRLPEPTRQKAVKYAKALSIPKSSFVRILVDLGLQQVEQDPQILIKDIETFAISGKS